MYGALKEALLVRPEDLVLALCGLQGTSSVQSLVKFYESTTALPSMQALQAVVGCLQASLATTMQWLLMQAVASTTATVTMVHRSVARLPSHGAVSGAGSGANGPEDPPPLLVHAAHCKTTRKLRQLTSLASPRVVELTRRALCGVSGESVDGDTPTAAEDRRVLLVMRRPERSVVLYGNTLGHWPHIDEVVEASEHELEEQLEAVDRRYETSRLMEDGDDDECTAAAVSADLSRVFLPTPLEQRVTELLATRATELEDTVKLGSDDVDTGHLRDPTVCMVVEGLMRAHHQLQLDTTGTLLSYAHCPTGASLYGTRTFVFVVHKNNSHPGWMTSMPEVRVFTQEP